MQTHEPLRRSERLFLLVLLLAALALRLYQLTRQDIWWDEARNIDVALRPFLQVATAPELDIHPPVYFWLLHLWTQLAAVTRTIDAAQIAYLSRWLSVAAGVLSVPLLFQVTRAVGGNTAALAAATLGTFTPFWLAESQEARMYTVGFALLLAAAAAFVRVI
ncbi:MAG: glycosyltransferase family 39 protein, partial [Caldilineaceae bacterium]